MISTFTISDSQVYSSYADDNSMPFARETEQAFSNQCTTYSLNMPEVMPGAAGSGSQERQSGPDYGVGRNVREAVAIVKDWVR